MVTEYCEYFSLISNVSACTSYRSMATGITGILDDCFYGFLSTQFLMIDRYVSELMVVDLADGSDLLLYYPQE